MIVRKDDSLIERLVLAYNTKKEGVAVTNAKNAVRDSREGSA